MPKWYARHTWRNRAFTLPELMMTVVIGVVLMAGLTVMFSQFSQGMEFTKGFHSQLQKVERFREEFEYAIAEFPLPIGEASVAGNIDEFGFEAAAFANADGSAGFVVGAVAESWTGFFVSAQYPYGKYSPVILRLDREGVAEVRSQGMQSFAAGADVSKGIPFPEIFLSRLVATPYGNGGMRIDVSYLAAYDAGLKGKSFALAKLESNYDAFPSTLRSSAATADEWSAQGCFSTVRTVNARSYAVPAVSNLAKTSVTVDFPVPNGKITYRQSFACQDGSITEDGAEVVANVSCETNFVWNGSECTVNSSRTELCAGLPDNASWNGTSSIGQAWNGSEWIPSATGTHNVEPSTLECRFVCNSGYSWNGSQCGRDCPVPSSEEYEGRTYVIGTLWKIGHGVTGSRNAFSFFGTAPENGSLSILASYSCLDGTLMRESIVPANGTCATNFTWNGNRTDPECVADSRTFVCAAKPETGTTWNSVASYSQTWSGSLSAWLPADSVTTYSASASTTTCKYACSSGYGWNGSECGVTVNGVCGSSNGGTFATAPTANLCSQWTPTALAVNGLWTGWIWSCGWAYEGTSANCSANASAFFFSHVISSNTTNFDIKARAVAAWWNQILPLDATVTVGTGVNVGSSSTSGYAIDTWSGFPTGTVLRVINHGNVLGAGGSGWCGWGYHDVSSDAYHGTCSGGGGGTALRAQYAVTVTNNGTIAGGGGGGGGGSVSSWYNSGGGGGGGGQGYSWGGGGSGAGNAYVWWGGGGGGGSVSSAGWGGGGGVVGFAWWNGGTLWQAGGPWVGWGNWFGPGGGWAAGSATLGNSNITWVTTGARLGPLN